MIMNARDRVARVVAERIEAQAITAENRSLAARSTVYAGQNRVQPLGAETAVRPKALQTNAGVPVGAPVQFNQNLAAATPGRGGVFNQFDQIGMALEAAGRRNAGLQSGEDNPNDSDLVGRFPNDAYVQYNADATKIEGVFVWSDSEREWLELPSGGGLTPIVGIPTANGTTDREQHLQTNGRLWIWSAAQSKWVTQNRVTWGDRAPQWQRGIAGDVHYKATTPDKGYVCGYILNKKGYDNGLRWGPMPSNHADCPLPINEDPSDDIPGDYAALCAADAPASFNGTRTFYAGRDTTQFACFPSPEAAAIAQEGYAWYDPETGQVEPPPNA